MPLRDAKARRLVAAILENLAKWIEDAQAIADEQPAGSKGRALHLAANMEQSRRALVHLVEED